MLLISHDNIKTNKQDITLWSIAYMLTQYVFFPKPLLYHYSIHVHQCLVVLMSCEQS